MEYLDYSDPQGWILKEKKFNKDYLGKCEAIMCLGNGYMGLRSSTEENYLGEQRDMLIAGTFNKAGENETTEIPNAADVTQMDIILDGEKFSLTEGEIISYERTLNMKNGELVRSVAWKSPAGKRYEITFKRVVSLQDVHIIAQRVEIRPFDSDCHIKLVTGINGRMTNEGAQHFDEIEKRLIRNEFIQYTQQTKESKIDFVITSVVDVFDNGKEISIKPQIGMERRKVFCTYEMDAKKDENLAIEKISSVHTSRDQSSASGDLKLMQQDSVDSLKDSKKEGYANIQHLSETAWNKHWKMADIKIESDNKKDQMAIRFAMYHLKIMTIFSDGKTNIGAKGLSGEAYKGHTFWDTEVFILPFFSYVFPKIAQKLIKYRYNTIDGARKKAKEGGYRGAQYPWESAWIEDGEVTPELGDADIITGLPQVIWTGKIEQHITADVAYGLMTFYKLTNDSEFMENHGYEILFETATFWASRWEKGDDGMFHINNVIGPDEYKEHVNDNAFTNYMSYWNVKAAIEYCEKLKTEKIDVYEKIDKKIDLEKSYKEWTEKLDKLYLPKENNKGIIPQDSTYLSLKNIDLTKYKEQDYVLGIYKDYNAKQLNDIQVSKQADLIILFLLLEDYFSKEAKAKNFEYYEARTLHDSSLSLSTHCILANDIGERKLAYELFEQITDIDMGQNMKSSNAGIHAATMGGMWQAVVFGFGGLRLSKDIIRINRNLPDEWNSLTYKFCYKGCVYEITETKSETSVVKKYGENVYQFMVDGEVVSK